MSSAHPKLLTVATETPEYEVTQAEAADVARRVFAGFRGLERLLPVFENSLIRRRFFCVPPEWFLSEQSVESRNRIYVEHAAALSERAVREALRRCGLQPQDVDYLIFVSTTGLATPSIDAHLINRLGLRRDVRHSPVWGRGCAGGAYGLAHAADFLRGHPEGVAVVVTAEFCGLTFLPGDRSRSNVVASALFADGVAAAVLAGGQTDHNGLPIVATRSHFFQDSLEVMGWSILSSGLQVVFQRRIPALVRRHARDVVGELLAEVGSGLSDVEAYLLHPGGRKVLEAYHEALGLEPALLELSRTVLADYGNMSSSTILFVIERFLAERTGAERGYAVASALGPGFCAESLLLHLEDDQRG